MGEKNNISLILCKCQCHTDLSCFNSFNLFTSRGSNVHINWRTETIATCGNYFDNLDLDLIAQSPKSPIQKSYFNAFENLLFYSR